jgi:anti-sigma factor RsiW
MGADPVDEAAIIAWVDGELTGAEAVRVEAAVANDADWRALADRHRRMKARFAAAFDPLARPPAEVISLADVRARRAAKAAPAPSHGWRRWAAGGAIAASLVVGLFVLQDRGGAPGGGVPASVAVALNDQLSGDAGAGAGRFVVP